AGAVTESIRIASIRNNFCVTFQKNEPRTPTTEVTGVLGFNINLNPELFAFITYHLFYVF
ncbi:MAG: hypothetical protein WAM95_17115, partial [Bacillus sp. (in: firmicutes)]